MNVFQKKENLLININLNEEVNINAIGFKIANGKQLYKKMKINAQVGHECIEFYNGEI
jgi:hypothetical protein